MLELVAEFENVNQLYRAYMPFVSHGGVFISTRVEINIGEPVKVALTLPDDLEPTIFESKVVWLNPAGVQGARPIGVGVSLPSDNIKIKTLIEQVLNTKLNAVEITATM